MPRPPRIARPAAHSHGFAAPVFGPGAWRIQMNAFGVATVFDLPLHPNGAVQGTQVLMGMAVPLQGGWGFDPSMNVLTLQLLAVMMGMPARQDLMQIRNVGGSGGVLQGRDALGRQFLLQRLG